MTRGPGNAPGPLPTSDRVIVVMLLAFSVFNVTLDLLLVVNAGHLVESAGRDRLSSLWTIYAAADRFWIVGPWSLAQETLNVFGATPLNVWLIWAIIMRRAYRHALQLALGAFLSYSVVLYYLAGHLSGYAGMRHRTADSFLLFYGASLPWLLFHLYLTCHSSVAITRRFARTAART